MVRLMAMTLDPETIRIVVGPNYSYWVGYVTRDGDMFVIRVATPIRQWGTSKGLYELCDGPTKATVLRAPAPKMKIHVLTAREIELTEKGIAAWHKRLAE